MTQLVLNLIWMATFRAADSVKQDLCKSLCSEARGQRTNRVTKIKSESFIKDMIKAVTVLMTDTAKNLFCEKICDMLDQPSPPKTNKLTKSRESEIRKTQKAR